MQQSLDQGSSSAPASEASVTESKVTEDHEAQTSTEAGSEQSHDEHGAHEHHYVDPLSNRVAFSIAGLLIAVLSSLAAVVGFQQRGDNALETNHTFALHALEDLAKAQEDFQSKANADRDKDGIGEYGDFAELSELLSAEWSQGSAKRVVMHGYVFEIHVAKDPARRERKWRAYAWPEAYGESGKYAFTCGESGEVLVNSNDETRYSGKSRIPPVNAISANPTWKAAH